MVHTGLVLLLIWVMMVPQAWAFPASGASCLLAWEESPAPSIPMQYYLYARRAGESYQFAIRQPKGGHAVASAENRVGSVAQQLSCERVVLAGEGRHYLVITAVALEREEESPPSNEIWLDVRGGVMVAHGQVTDETPAPSPDHTPPQIPVVPPAPPERPKGPQDTKPPPAFIVKRPPAPSPPGGGSSLADSCIWNGCQSSPWSRILPPGFGQGSPSLEGSTIWNGRP